MVGQKKKRAFTLLELILVLLIIATCAAIAVPVMRNFVKSRVLPNTAQELATIARWCRVQAISDGVTYRLNFETGEGTSRWWVTKAADPTGLTYDVVSTVGIKQEYPLPEQLTMETDIPITSDENNKDALFISFDPGGRTDVATIWLNDGSVERAVTCDTPMGTYYVSSRKRGER